MLNHNTNHDRLEEKRDELIEVALTALDGSDYELAEQLVNSLCRLSAPLDPPIVIEMITVHSRGARGGQSRKSGNILINWAAFIRTFGDIGLSIAAGVAEHRLIPFAALVVWDKVWSNAKIKLSPEHATLLYSMWLSRKEGNTTSRSEAFEMGKLVFRQHGFNELDEDVCQNLLNDLVGLECIEFKTSNTIWLREWVRKSYL